MSKPTKKALSAAIAASARMDEKAWLKSDYAELMTYAEARAQLPKTKKASTPAKKATKKTLHDDEEIGLKNTTIPTRKAIDELAIAINEKRNFQEVAESFQFADKLCLVSTGESVKMVTIKKAKLYDKLMLVVENKEGDELSFLANHLSKHLFVNID